MFADNGDPRLDGFGGVRVRSLSVGSRSRSGILNSTFLQQSGLIKFGKYYQGVLCGLRGRRSAGGDEHPAVDRRPLQTMPEEHYIDPDAARACTTTPPTTPP